MVRLGFVRRISNSVKIMHAESLCILVRKTHFQSCCIHVLILAALSSWHYLFAPY